LNSLEGFLFHEKRSLHRAVVTPEPYCAQCRIVGATAIGKIKRHVPGTASSMNSRLTATSLSCHLCRVDGFPRSGETRTATPPARP
jgi:hypothetical protein